MQIKDKILDFYNLKDNGINNEIYLLKKSRYLAFLDDIIIHSNIESFLQPIAESVHTKKFKTIVVVAETNEFFSKGDLLYFNGVDTVIVFVLFDNLKKEIYYIASWLCISGLTFKKIVKQIVNIISLSFDEDINDN